MSTACTVEAFVRDFRAHKGKSAHNEYGDFDVIKTPARIGVHCRHCEFVAYLPLKHDTLGLHSLPQRALEIWVENMLSGHPVIKPPTVPTDFVEGARVESRNKNNKHRGTVVRASRNSVEIRHDEGCCESANHVLFSEMPLEEALRSWHVTKPTAWQRMLEEEKY